MSAARKMDMRKFFAVVKKKEMHLANLQVQHFRDEEKAEVEAEERKEREVEIARRNDERKAIDKKRRIDARNAGIAVDKRSEEEKVQDEIDGFAEDIPDLLIPEEKEYTKRVRRPENWEDIAFDAQVYGNEAALRNFPAAFAGASSTATYQRLNQWKNDIKNNKVFTKKIGFNLPTYGTEIDLQLLADCGTTRDAGLPIDDVILRRLLVVRLLAAGKEGLLKENGGKFSYGHSWAMRFFKRHNLVVRVCTTKMRELPADFDAKKALYMKIGANLIYKHNVPKELVINGDETAVLLVNRAKVTRSVSGVKRVKILGMGDDKAQITATLFVTEAGDVLPYQMIFTGTTDRCHPASGKPTDCLWAHTKSHWQTVDTYLDLLEKVIVPYKNNMIRNLGLPVNQVTILKHDLHFTHKDARVLQFLKDNFICPLFVPAGCTDVIQECDVVVNKPFKNAVRSAFRDHLNALFQAHLAKGLPSTEFSPKLTMGALKPHLTGFVQKGILALTTPEMRECIKNSFARNGCFEQMRSAQMQLIAQMEEVHIVDEPVIDEAVEEDEFVEELGAISDVDSDSDDN